MFDEKKYNREYARKWRKNNPERANEIARQWALRNKDKIKKWGQEYREKNHEEIGIKRKQEYRENREKYLEYVKQYQKDNREKRLEYKRKYRKTDKSKKNIKEYYHNNLKTNLKYNLNRTMRITIGHSLKGSKAGRHWEELIGYSLSDLMKHLKRTLPLNYTWKDYLDGKLHVDHIIPISAYEFDKSENFQFIECWSLKNLRLLPAKENIIKGGKIIKPYQLALKI